MIGDWLDPSRMSQESRKVYQQEGLIVDITELIAGAMEEQGVTKAELAKRLGKSRSFITQILDGTANMTLKTIADVFTAMDLELDVSCHSPVWVTKQPKPDAACPPNSPAPAVKKAAHATKPLKKRGLKPTAPMKSLKANRLSSRR